MRLFEFRSGLQQEAMTFAGYQLARSRYDKLPRGHAKRLPNLSAIGDDGKPFGINRVANDLDA